MSSVGSSYLPLIWQQIVALDAKYNPHRNFDSHSCNFRTLYIKRRNQLLRESVRRDGDLTIRKQYLKIRSQLLSTRHGPLYADSTRKLSSRTMLFSPHDTSSGSGSFEGIRNAKVNTFTSNRFSSDETTSIDLDDRHVRSTSDSRESSSGLCTDFSGMHHVFDQHKQAVSAVRFAHNDKSLLACSSLDSTLSICQITPPPATVLYIMRGHSAAVCDFQWSISNDFLASCSLDGTVRLWDTASGTCLRVIKDPTDSPILTCAYQPSNNNMVIIGNEKGYVHVLNVSTGIPVKSGSLRTNANCSVQCLTFDNNGRTVWVGDSKGFIYSFSFDLISGRLCRLTRTLIHPGSSITCLTTRPVVRHQMRTTFLLVNCAPNTLALYEITGDGLKLRHKFPIKHHNGQLMIRSSFCPLTSLKESVCIASGSEDGNIYFFSASFHTNANHLSRSYNEQHHHQHQQQQQQQHVGDAGVREKCLASLQGHAAPVIDVCLNFDESLLASSDQIGNVIVWKKMSQA